MDGFEIRMNLVGHLRKLNASLSSVKRVVGCLNIHAQTSAGDLWKCLMGEFRKGSLNHRLNILYMLDDLLNTGSSDNSVYQSYASDSLIDIINMVVPEERNGIINLLSTLQILESWKIKRIFDIELLNNLQSDLESKRELLSHKTQDNDKLERLSTKDILRRFEEDRERHKRLREDIWVLPISNFTKEDAMNYQTPSPEVKQQFASNLLTFNDNNKSLDIEFDNRWDEISDYNEDDVEEMLDDLNSLHRAQFVN